MGYSGGEGFGDSGGFLGILRVWVYSGQGFFGCVLGRYFMDFWCILGIFWGYSSDFLGGILVSLRVFQGVLWVFLGYSQAFQYKFSVTHV